MSNFKIIYMKSFAKNLQYVLVATLLLSASTVIYGNTIKQDKFDVLVTADELVGAWVYTVDNVDYQYSKGVLLIAKENGEYNVQVQLSQGVIPGEEVEVDGNTITFSVNIEGQTISVKLTVEGEKIFGESSSSDGVFKIVGTKQVQPE